MDLRDAYFQEDSFRFATLLLASLVSLISSSINFTFPSIAPTLEFSFNTNSYDLYILTISYSIIYLFFSIPASFFIEKYGIRISLLICMILQSVGCFIRLLFSQSNQSPLFIGQFIASLGAPFSLNTISKISVLWFKPEHRITSTAIITSSQMLGTGLTFILAFFSIDNQNQMKIFETDDPKMTIEQRAALISNGIQQIKTYLFLIFLLAIIILAAIYVFFQEKPEIPTCFIAELPRENFAKALKKMASRMNYLLLAAGFAVLASNYGILMTFINSFFLPFALSQKEIAFLGSILNFSTFCGKICVGFFAGKYISYKNTLLFITGASFITMGFFIIALFQHNFAAIALNSVFFGFFLQMYWAPALEFGCEIVFPIGEANANGGLIMAGCLANVLVGGGLSGFFEDGGNKKSIFWFFGSLFVAYFLFFLTKESLNREQKEIEMIIEDKFQNNQIRI